MLEAFYLLTQKRWASRATASRASVGCCWWYTIHVRHLETVYCRIMRHPHLLRELIHYLRKVCWEIPSKLMKTFTKSSGGRQPNAKTVSGIICKYAVPKNGIYEENLQNCTICNAVQYSKTQNITKKCYVISCSMRPMLRNRPPGRIVLQTWHWDFCPPFLPILWTDLVLGKKLDLRSIGYHKPANFRDD